MKDIIKIITFNVRFFHIAFIIISIFISSSINFSQDYIKELPKEKNQLFWLLKVKVETIKEENFRVADSTNRWKNITKNYYDSNGYLVKREIFDSSYTIPSQVCEYKYDENGNYTEFFLNGKLRELREYNKLGKITRTNYYTNGDITKTHLYKYDSFGNEIEILIKYSSGRIDTFLITRYNYDYSVSPPLIKSDTTFYNEQNYKQIFISESDSIGRCTKLIVLHSDSTYNYTTLFYYNDRNLFDSTIQFSKSGVSKYLREYDSYQRLIKTIDYMDTDSIPSICHCSYDDNIFMTIDSLFQKNDLDLTMISDFEKIGVVLETLHKGEYEIRAKIMTQYYSNVLVKNTLRYDYYFDKIEKKLYDYEYY